MSAAMADDIFFAKVVSIKYRGIRSETRKHQMFSCEVSVTWLLDKKCYGN